MAGSSQGDVPPHADDPVQGNPFPVDDQRHEAWARATRVAQLDLHRLKQRTLEKPRPQSPEEDQHLLIEFIFRRFQIWAKRGLSVVWTYECARAYERWLDAYMQAELAYWEENCRAAFQKQIFFVGTQEAALTGFCTLERKRVENGCRGASSGSD